MIGIVDGNAQRDVTAPTGRGTPRRMVTELNGSTDDERVVYRRVPAGQAIRLDAFGVELEVFVNRAPDPTFSGGPTFFHDIDTAFGDERGHTAPVLTTTTPRRRFQSSCVASATPLRQRIRCNAARWHPCPTLQWRRRCGSSRTRRSEPKTYAANAPLFAVGRSRRAPAARHRLPSRVFRRHGTLEPPPEPRSPALRRPADSRRLDL